MTQLYASIAIGTTATVIAVLLLLLRAEFHGRRTVLALTRRWVAARTRTSSLVLMLLAAVAASAFALVPTIDGSDQSTASARTTASATTMAPTDGSGADPELAALQAYVDKTDGKLPSTAAVSPAPDAPDLPDVETMIAKLVARLEKQPDDARGWKMLGWSYLNTGRPAEATRAYETALKLNPGDAEAMKALEAARAAGP